MTHRLSLTPLRRPFHILPGHFPTPVNDSNLDISFPSPPACLQPRIPEATPVPGSLGITMIYSSPLFGYGYFDFVFFDASQRAIGKYLSFEEFWYQLLGKSMYTLCKKHMDIATRLSHIHEVSRPDDLQEMLNRREKF